MDAKSMDIAKKVKQTLQDVRETLRHLSRREDDELATAAQDVTNAIECVDSAMGNAGGIVTMNLD